MGSTTQSQGGDSAFTSVVETFRDAGRLVRDLAAGIVAPGVAASEWRRRRLLILGYHGVSLEDEHLWDGIVYMTPTVFRRRLTILKETNCAVLPLDTALQGLYDGTLPPKAVTLVFDDGFSDFARVTAPLLAEFDYKATVYLSSYYSEFNRPIFDSMLHYLLWKGSQKSISLPGVLDGTVRLNDDGRKQVYELLRAKAFEAYMTGREKDALLARVAEALNIDYGELCRKRLLHMMNGREIREVKAFGHNIQMHTHRHRVSRKQELFDREIHDNRLWIEREAGGARPVHFSFPGGVWQPVERKWLTELGIQSAITCRPALADPRCDKLLLPRFVDSNFVRESAFRGWISGSMSFLPIGKEVPTTRQILEDTIQASDVGTRVRSAKA